MFSVANGNEDAIVAKTQTSNAKKWVVHFRILIRLVHCCGGISVTALDSSDSSPYTKTKHNATSSVNGEFHFRKVDQL